MRVEKASKWYKMVATPHSPKGPFGAHSSKGNGTRGVVYPSCDDVPLAKRQLSFCKPVKRKKSVAMVDVGMAI